MTPAARSESNRWLHLPVVLLRRLLIQMSAYDRRSQLIYDVGDDGYLGLELRTAAALARD
jgi:hypothetical protein